MRDGRKENGTALDLAFGAAAWKAGRASGDPAGAFRFEQFLQRIKKALGKLGSQGGLGFLVSAESDWTSVDLTSVSGRTLLG